MADRKGFVSVRRRRNHNPKSCHPRNRANRRSRQSPKNDDRDGKSEMSPASNDDRSSDRSDSTISNPVESDDHSAKTVQQHHLITNPSNDGLRRSGDCVKSPSPPKENAKKLIVLDIFGILCCKVMYDKCPKQDAVTFAEENGMEHITLNVYSVFIRPYVRQFLDHCYDYADVGFFSSSTEPNSIAVLRSVLTDEQQEKTRFFWYRDRTKLDPDYGKDFEITNYDTVKILADIFQSPYVNRYRCYDEYNTIICDDSPRKMRYNDQSNVLLIPSFDIDNEISEWLLHKDNTTEVKTRANDRELIEISRRIPEMFIDLEQKFVADDITRRMSTLLE